MKKFVLVCFLPLCSCTTVRDVNGTKVLTASSDVTNVKITMPDGMIVEIGAIDNHKVHEVIGNNVFMSAAPVGAAIAGL